MFWASLGSTVLSAAALSLPSAPWIPSSKGGKNNEKLRQVKEDGEVSEGKVCWGTVDAWCSSWWTFPTRGQMLTLLGGTGCVRTGIGLMLIWSELGAQEAERMSKKQNASRIFFICCRRCVQPPREYNCIYTLRLKSKTEEKWRCYSCCGNSEDYKGGKHSRDMRKFNLVLQVVLTSQQQPRFSPASRHFGSIAKSQSPRNCKFTPAGFCFPSSGKGGRGAKTDGNCQPAQKLHASGGVLFMETFRSNNHRRSLISIWEEEFGSYGPVLPSFKHLLYAWGRTRGQQGHPSSRSPMRSLGWWKASLMYNISIRRNGQGTLLLKLQTRAGLILRFQKCMKMLMSAAQNIVKHKRFVI